MRPLITLKDYETVFRILYSVSASVGNTAGKACLFYNVIGARMLNEHLKVEARPVVGSAFFLVHDQSNTVLSYSQIGADGPFSSPEAFHCWIECEGYVIDFTAPVFRESLSEVGQQLQIPRKMFQRPLSKMAKSWTELNSAGDFWLTPNVELTAIALRRFLEKPAPSDLANVCLHWFKKNSKTPESLSMINDLGEITEMKLANIRLSEAW